MAIIDYQYNYLARVVLKDGFFYKDKSRNNMLLLQIPSYTLTIEPEKGFPLLTTKRIFYKSIIHELIWMLSGSTNINYLQENNVKIWNQDAYNFSGGTEVGRIYGAQWRSWADANKPLDQITSLIKSLKEDLYSRGHLVTTWNPAEIPAMALRPCHWAFEIVPLGASPEDGFCLNWFQRSCDAFLGLPFDIGLYAFLGKLIEHETGIPFKKLRGNLSNIHFYEPHIDLINTQLSRPIIHNETSLTINKDANFNNLSINDFIVSGYESNPPIKAKMYAKNEI